MEPQFENFTESGLMLHREITLADGRYMIFYTFPGEIFVTRGPEKQEPTQNTPNQKNV